MLVSQRSWGLTQTFGCWIFVSLAALLCSGCGGDTSGRIPLAGEVTLNGAALDRGSIGFHPPGGGGPTGGTITDGRFEIPVEQGVMPGTYTVRIFSAAEGAAEGAALGPPGPEAEQPPAAERIPSRYNVNSELQTAISDANAQQLEFDLQT